MNKKYINYASYFGVNRPINPGIRVLVDFLNNYFKPSLKLPKVKELFDIERIKEMENIICKETDEKMRDTLYESFSEWVESYCFFYSYINKNDARYLLPLTKNMIYEDTLTRDRLRNILFRLLYANLKGDKLKYIENDRKMIEDFLFTNSNSNNIYENIITVLDSMIEKKELPIENKNFAKSQEDSGDVLPDSKLADNFREDFEALLQDKVFSKLDIYRKINMFTLLLNFYVTLYAVNKAYDGEEVFILAKGSPDFSTENGRFHSAALGNFSNIRERIFKVSENFYEYKITRYTNNASLRIRVSNENKIEILCKSRDIWPDLKENLFDSKSLKKDDSIDTFIKDYLEVDQSYKQISIKALARAFVELSKKRSSSVRMVSTMFSGQGKEAHMVFPITNAKHKYYAMSSELTELLLKLFLACNKTEYATLNMFLSWLENRYGIYINFSNKLMDYLSENSIKEPSNAEFTQNIQAFISTLDSISAIEKLSDNSFIVYDSGKIGGLSWVI